MKTLLKIVCGIVIILLLNFLINLLFVSKNNGKKYIEEYKKASKELKVKVNPVFFEGRNTQDSYFKGTVFFKGLYGGYSGKIIKDDYSERYFKIIRLDPYGDKFYLAQSAKIDNKELIVKAYPAIVTASLGTQFPMASLRLNSSLYFAAARQTFNPGVIKSLGSGLAWGVAGAVVDGASDQYENSIYDDTLDYFVKYLSVKNKESKGINVIANKG